MKTKSSVERLFHMWPVKVLSVAAAVLLYFFTSLLNLETRTVTLPIHYLLAPGYTQATEYPTKAKIRLRGTSDKIFGILEEDLTLSADFRKYDREGQFQVPLSIRRTGAAATVEPLDISVDPGMINLSIERSETRELPVNARFSGSPKPGYQVVTYELVPHTLTVNGPSGRIRALNALETEPVDLSARSADFTQKIRPLSPDNLITTIGQDTIEVKVAIGQAVNKRTFAGISLSVIGLSPDLSYEAILPAGTVTIQADTGDLEKLNSGQVRVLVDASGIKASGTYRLKTICEAPPRSLILSIDPENIDLVVNQTLNPK